MTADQTQAVTAEREAFEAYARRLHWHLTREGHWTGVFGEGYESGHTNFAWTAWQARAALSSPAQCPWPDCPHGADCVHAVAAQPAASGVDAQWVKRLRETASHLRENSLSLAKYPGMGDEARARELAALYIGEIAEMYAARESLRNHLSTALTGAAQSADSAMEVLRDPVTANFSFETLSPLDGMDAIYAEYAKTFGRFPDAFMAKVVAQTKEDLFIWWGAHRERIREALALADPGPEARARLIREQSERDRARALTRQGDTA
jgi:hypothetical protein